MIGLCYRFRWSDPMTDPTEMKRKRLPPSGIYRHAIGNILEHTTSFSYLRKERIARLKFSNPRYDHRLRPHRVTHTFTVWKHSVSSEQSTRLFLAHICGYRMHRLKFRPSSVRTSFPTVGGVSRLSDHRVP